MTLTKEQAIKRIIDIQLGLSCEHLDRGNIHESGSMKGGAQDELAAIFDISDHEIYQEYTSR